MLKEKEKEMINLSTDKRLGDAWRELFADKDFSPYGIDHCDYEYCIFCGELSSSTGGVDDIQHVEHKEDCIYLRVKAILAADQLTTKC